MIRIPVRLPRAGAYAICVDGSFCDYPRVRSRPQPRTLIRVSTSGCRERFRVVIPTYPQPFVLPEDAPVGIDHYIRAIWYSSRDSRVRQLRAWFGDPATGKATAWERGRLDTVGIHIGTLRYAHLIVWEMVYGGAAPLSLRALVRLTLDGLHSPRDVGAEIWTHPNFIDGTSR